MRRHRIWHSPPKNPINRQISFQCRRARRQQTCAIANYLE